jgi:hypothetical protein
MAGNRDSEQTAAAPTGRTRRWLWIVLGAMAVLLLLALIVLPRLLDPESYRGRIEQALQEATGWETELGEIDLSVLRGLALTVSPASLTAPGAGSRLEIERIAVDADLLPLLRGNLIVRRIDLVRPEIELIRPGLEEGWELPALIGSAPELHPTAGGAEGGLEVSIEEVRVRGGLLRLEDRSVEPARIVGLREVDLDLYPADGRIGGNGELIDGGGLAWKGSLNEGLMLTLDAVPTDLFVPFIGEGLVHRGGSLSGEIEAQLPVRIGGRLEGRQILLLEGEEPFQEVTAQFELSGTGSGWKLEQLRLDADGARIQGSGPLLPSTALELELTPTPLETALRAADSVLPLPLDLAPPGSVQARLWADRVPGSELTYRASGELSAARFRPAETLPDATDVRAAFTLSPRGALEIRVLEGRVGGGPLGGTARIDQVFPPGTLSFDGELQDAILGELLGPLVSEAAKRVTGPTGLEAGVTLDLGRETLDARALGGALELDSRSVSLPGWDLEGAVRRKIEEKGFSLSDLNRLLGRESEDAAGTEAAESAGGAVEALLDRLGARIDFDTWPWTLERLDLAAGDVAAAGRGSFDPERGAVDLELTARLDAEATAELVGEHRELRLLVDEQGRLALPVSVRGPLLSPSIGVELGELLSDEVEDEVKKEAVEGLLKGLLDRKKKK